MLTIGVLGGMGPSATNHLCALITQLTPAKTDQEHIPVICFNNPRIPDRSHAILDGGASPLPEMARTARALIGAGADFLVMPCNSAHFYHQTLSSQISKPVLNMIAATAAEISDRFPETEKVGLLATTGTVKAKIYDPYFQKVGMRIMVPPEAEQAALVMAAIYAVKSGEREAPRRLFMQAADLLRDRGAGVIVAGCTEIPLVLTANDVALPLLDTTEILARAAVKRARSTTGSGTSGKS